MTRGDGLGSGRAGAADTARAGYVDVSRSTDGGKR